MNQNCVPTWNNNLEDASHPIPLRSPPQPLTSFTTHPSPASPSAGPSDTSMLDYEMAELGWENGQLTMHGLGLPRVPSKSNVTDTRANGMLESIVNQAYCHSNREPTQTAARVKGGCQNEDDDIVPWGPAASRHVPVTLDALVPNNTTMGCSTLVGSCSAAAAREPKCSDWGASVSVSASESIRRKRQAEDTCEQMWSMNNNNNGLASTSFAASLENTTTFTLDDHDSASQSRSQKEMGEEGENQKQGTAKSTGSTKRSRAAAVHNQSERKRRDKINQRMKTLQKLVPNSNKTDKASMLDEVIEYLKNLQAQVDMLSRMSVPSMMMPLAIQHQLQMSMMAPVGLGMGMGMGMDNLSNMGRPNMTGVSPSLLNMAAAYNMTLANCDNNGTTANGVAYNMPQGNLVSTDPLSAYLACHSNPMTMDAYSKMAAIYQQQTQQHQPQQQKQSYQQQPACVPSSNK